MPGVDLQLVITDYDDDKVVIDCRMPTRFYIESMNAPDEAQVETCISLDRRAAQAIIKLLQEWLGNDDEYAIKPTVITYERF